MAGLPRARRPAAGPSESAVNAEIRRIVRLALSDPPAAGVGSPPGASAATGPHPSEYTLASYLEGQLHGPAEEAFERHVALCPTCAEELVLAHRSGAGAAHGHSTRPWKIAAALAVIFAGLVAALLAAGAMGGRVEQATLAAVRGALGDKARVESASLTLAGGPGVELADLTVPGPDPDAPILSAPSARFNLDVAGLGQGRVAGRLHLNGPIINVVREPSGGLNIDAVLPRSKGGAGDLLAQARRRAIRAVEISSGTLRVIDRSGGERREIRMAAVDAALTDIDDATPTRLAARAGLESTRQNLRLAGEVGPWGEGVKPVYRFPEVGLDQVAIRSLPGIGSVMRGGLSFDGSLAGAGESWAEISSSLAGRGDLRVVSGSIAGHNVVADVLAPLLGVAEAAASPPGTLQTLLAAEDTSFGEMHSPVAVAGLRLEASDFALSGNGFAVTGRGSLAAGGDVEFRGELAVSPATARELLALVPDAGTLMNDRGEISIPFGVTGGWPRVRVTVDVEKLAARTVLRHGLARLLFAPLRGLGLLG